MKKHIVIITRYSLASERAHISWKIGHGKSYREYEAELFSAERMSQHQRLFNDVALASVLAQKPLEEGTKVTWLVVSSAGLPAANKAYLDDLSKKHPWIKPLYLDPKHNWGLELGKQLSFSEDTCYLTLRLDDDDALACDFLQRCEPYLNQRFTGFGLSFGRGYQGIYDPEAGNYRQLEEIHYPQIAIGLGFINLWRVEEKDRVCKPSSIYSLGNHIRIDRKVPLIIDAMSPAYLRSLHQQSDTQGQVARKHVLNEVKDKSTFHRYFPFLAGR